jgi:hypothetical protein
MAPGNLGGDNVLKLLGVHGNEPLDVLYQEFDRLLYVWVHGLSYVKTPGPNKVTEIRKPCYNHRMGRFLWLGLAILLLAALLFAGCVGLGQKAGGPVENVTPATAGGSVPPQAPDSPLATVSPTGRLEDPAFKGLAPEVLDYLGALARAFAGQDTAFLIAQGEVQYEAQLRHQYDEGEYLAMLYRTDPGLIPQEILGIEYISWEDQGPMLEIHGRLIGAKGKTSPCVIVFNPRLVEPRILGLYP